MAGDGAAERRMSSAVVVLVATGYGAAIAGVVLCPALVPEPGTWLDASAFADDHPLGLMAANGLYWLLVLAAAAAIISGITLAGRAALRQLTDAVRVAEGDIGLTPAPRPPAPRSR
jgi:hypothetical protein